jgi:hypothetical protein
MAVRATSRRPTARRLLDLATRYGPIVVVILGGAWTASTWYADRMDKSREEQRRSSEAAVVALRESQKPFLERQLAFYFEAAKVTGKLATLPPVRFDKPLDHKALEDWAWSRRRFWELYWGELGVVESTDVSRAMVSFGNALNAVESCVDAGRDCRNEQSRLTGPSLALAREIRASIEKGWGYSLPPTAR